MEKDPVCGMGVEIDSPETCSMNYHGTIYHFCSVDCFLLFTRAPKAYLNVDTTQRPSAKDVVCGMDVDMSNAPYTTGYEGTVYYFCSEACRNEFLYAPEQFAKTL
ncbi:MAG: YHS domain-containing protein [Bacteroidota bacterium]